jgi:hypothetical protein
MIVAIAFWAYCIFFAFAFLLVAAPALSSWLPELDQIQSIYLTYPALAFNASVGLYLVHYFMALDQFPNRLFLILFFVSISVMLGSGASLAFETTIAQTEVFRLAFGEGPLTAVVMGISTWSAAWSARQFNKQFDPQKIT